MLGAEALEALSSQEGTGISIDPAAASAALEDALLAHSQDWIALYYISSFMTESKQYACYACQVCMHTLHASACVCVRLYASVCACLRLYASVSACVCDCL